MEATPRFELGVKALQASALPLGHVARRFRQEKGRPNFFSIAGLLTIDGADDGVRTRDPDLGKVVLYQLSHIRVARKYDTGTTRGAQDPICHNFEKFLPARSQPTRIEVRLKCGSCCPSV